MSVARIRSRFTPTWEGSVEGWVVNYINAQLWRVRPHMDFDDMYQEAFLCFALCAEHYPLVVDPPHFMSLFKRAFVNRVTGMSNRRTKDRAFSYDENSELGGPPTSSGDLLARQQKMCPEMMGAELEMLIADAPTPIQDLVATVMEAPDELLTFLRDGTSGLRETMQARLARLGHLCNWAGYATSPDACAADFAAAVRTWAQ
jgi:hypothetical protein